MNNTEDIRSTWAAVWVGHNGPIDLGLADTSEMAVDLIDAYGVDQEHEPGWLNDGVGDGTFSRVDQFEFGDPRSGWAHFANQDHTWQAMVFELDLP